MGAGIIKVLDAVHCRADKQARKKILKCLSYTKVSWQKARFGGREQKIKKQYLITGRNDTSGLFLTGLLPKVKDYCNKKHYKISITNEPIQENEKIKIPKLSGIKFRPDPRRALRAVKRNKRGRSIFPTGSGKTIIALGIMSMFPNYRTLFLCHTKDLIEQTKKELSKYGFKKVHIIGAGYKANIERIFKQDKVIVLGTIQSFANIPEEKYRPFFDLTIVDEVHHVNSMKSNYGKVMENNLSPRRYGLPATEPSKKHEQLINEGCCGPTIAELSIEEGIEKGIIAQPIINLVPVPYNVKINQKCKNRYANYYKFGIVKSKERNKLIVKEVMDSLKKDEITLIIIEHKDHGEILKKMLYYNKVQCPFIYGNTSRIRRLKTKEKLQSGKLKVTICSKVWKEGINIPSLNHIIMAVGMKEEKMVIQAIGRGLRTTKDKTTVKLTDFLDPYRYLAEHSILRVQVYAKNKWL